MGCRTIDGGGTNWIREHDDDERRLFADNHPEVKSLSELMPRV